MTLKLKPQSLPSEIILPTSKSYANRLLIVAARLGEGRSIKHLPVSDDVTFLIDSFQRIGLNLEKKSDGLIFHNSFPECESNEREPIHLHVGEGGTTARFILSLLSLGSRKYVLSMEGRLPQRPWDGLIQVLRSAGVVIKWDNDHELSIQGPVQVEKLKREISCGDTTQFITSLQLSFFKEGITFKPLGLESSEAYWRMTLDCAQDFKERTVPQDWSSASYPIVLAALKNQKVLFHGLHPDPLQADSILFDILRERGAIEDTDEGVIVSGLKTHQPLLVNGSQCLDLIPTLTVLALKLKGKSLITHTRGLVAKESDRLAEILRLVKKMGGHITRDPDYSIQIEGGHQAPSLHLDPVADHRMVMMASIMLLTNEGGVVENEQAVSKSFPNFFEIVAPTRE